MIFQQIICTDGHHSMHHIASLDHNDLMGIQGVKGTSPLKTLHMYGNMKGMVSRKHGLKKKIGVVSQSFIRVSIVSKNIFITNTIFLLIHPAIKTLPAPTCHSGFNSFCTVNLFYFIFKPAQFKLTSFSKSNSKDGTQMGSSSGSWYLDRKGCFKARSTVMRSAGFITSILPIKSSAFLLALGKSVVHGMGWRWPRPVPHRQWHVCTAVTLTSLGHFASDLDLLQTDSDTRTLQWPWHH